MNQTIAHRLWAAAALVIAIATISFAIDVTLSRIPKGFTVVACVVLAVIVAAYGLMRRGPTRIVALAAAVLLLAGSIVLVFVEHDPTDDVLVAVGVVAVLAAARRAFRVRFEWPRARRPERPVLFFNPLSGGGKAARFDLAGQALRRGIEPIELRRGDDLEQLVRDAVSRGADALAMAGGDGSQAIVAMVAAELDLPYACIPSGTRNHFALDLGVDRDDVVGALDAFVDGRERRVDLAEVNDRVFVNNVSLGLYADAVERPGYREAKLRTLLDTIPEALGPSAAAPSLFWDGDAGRSRPWQSSCRTIPIASAGRSVRAPGPGSTVDCSASRRSHRPDTRATAECATGWGCVSGQMSPSRCRRISACRPGSTEKPSSWSRHFGSVAAAARCGCESRRPTLVSLAVGARAGQAVGAPPGAGPRRLPRRLPESRRAEAAEPAGDHAGTPTEQPDQRPS